MFDVEYLLYIAFAVAVLGFVISYLIERHQLVNHQVPIKSKSVSQYYIDSLDYTQFRFGRHRLCIGDEIKVISGDRVVIGTVLGAKSKEGLLCLVTRADEVAELSISAIKKFKILHKFGRLF